MIKKIILVLLVIELLSFSNYTVEFEPQDKTTLGEIHQNESKVSQSELPSLIISGNDQLASFASSGNGTKNDPYLLDNNKIETNDIQIRNTDNYFIVRNKIFNGTLSQNSCLSLLYVKNSIIENSTFSNCNTALFITNSNTINITKNTIQKNSLYGIEIVATQQITIMNNRIIKNKEYGIWCSCQNSLLENNSITNNNKGMYIESNNIIENNYIKDNVQSAIEVNNNFNIIKNNTLINNGLIMNHFASDSVPEGNLIENNTVNGKPLIFYEGDAHKTISESSGQIILLSCDFMTINNQNIANASVGIEIILGSNNHLFNNTAVNNSISGFELHFSISNTLLNNTAYNNANNGFYIDNTNNTIKNNVARNNSIGIYVSRPNYTKYNIYISDKSNIIEHNVLIDNKEAGFSINAKNNTIIANEMIHNGLITDELPFEDYLQYKVENNTVNGKPLVYYQNENNKQITEPVGEILAINCTFIQIKNQIIHNASRGIQIYQGNNIEIRNNSLIDNSLDGILLRSVENSIVTNNTSSFNKNNGLEVYSSFKVIIEHNVLNNNNQSGLALELSQNCSIRENIANKNQNGFYARSKSFSYVKIFYSSFDSWEGNIANNNSNVGFLISSLEITIQNNIANNNKIGFDLHITSSIVENNYGNYNTYIALYVYYGSLNKISSNKLDHSKKYGIFFENSYNNSLFKNIISNSTSYGLYLNNSIRENVLYLNAFVDNNGNKIQGYDNTNKSLWYNGTLGNYWSDYKGTDGNKDGIGDTPYKIDGQGGLEDKYPLMTMNKVLDKRTGSMLVGLLRDIGLIAVGGIGLGSILTGIYTVSEYKKYKKLSPERIERSTFTKYMTKKMRRSKKKTKEKQVSKEILKKVQEILKENQS